VFEGRDRGFLGYSREIVQKFVKILPAFQIIQKGLKRHTSASEYRRPSENVGILDDDVG